MVGILCPAETGVRLVPRRCATRSCASVSGTVNKTLVLNVRLQRSGNLLTVLVILLLALACISVGLALVFNREHRDTSQQMHDVLDSLSQLQAATHALTQSVHSYVVTNDENYYQNYLYEKTVSRRAELALQEFVGHSLSAGEMNLLLIIKQQAQQAEHLEMEALLQAREGRWEDAVQLLFGAEYQSVSAAAIGALQELQAAVRDRTEQRVSVLEYRSQVAGTLALVLVLISLLLVLLVLRGFFFKRVLSPVLQLTGAVHRQAWEEAGEHSVHRNDPEEIQELANAIRHTGTVLQQLEAERQRFSDAERWYRQIIEFAPDGMLVVDDQGDIVIANPKAHQQFGYQPGGLIGLRVEELMPVATRERHVHYREAFMRSSAQRAMDSVNGEFRALHADGHEFPVELGLTRLPPVDDRSESTCVTVRDITERKQYEQTIADQLEFQRVLLDTLPYPVFFKDSDARYLGFNQAFLEFFGVEREALLGKTVLQFIALPAQDRAAYQEANERILQHGGTYMAEMHIPDAANVLHPVLYSLASYPGSDGRIAGLVGTLIDIAAQKEAQRAQEEARALAEDATRLKSDFLANMSHEIRTPMNVIMGMAHLALSTELNKRQRNYVEKISTAAQGLLGIINDILDFSKIEAGKMHFERVDFWLEDVLNGLVDLATLRAQEKGLELLFDIAPEVPTGLIGDPLRLSQILNNLLSNAIKFTQRGEIRLSISTEQRQDSQAWLRFDVADTGIGMNEQQQQRLFQAFTQADSSTSRQFGGTGLGLAISKRLVDLMGGEIGVDSEPGIGSTFWFRVPLGVQEQQRELQIDDKDLHDLRILVVDDNASAREIFQTMLHSLRFAADTVADGTKALERLQTASEQGQPYQLLLLDWMMPGMDGISLLKQLMATISATQQPKVIMATAYNRDELLEQLQDVPVAAVLEKPVTPSGLLDGILQAFGREGVRRTRKRQRADQSAGARAALRGSRILLVEDNELNQEMTVEILAQAGLHTDVANNGAEALSMVAQRPYDAVLMDCQMPVMDGYEATRRIRAQERFRSLPILAMTANAMEADKERCREAGMDDHIAKPLDVQQLFMTLQRWIRNSAVAITPALPVIDDAPLPHIAGLQLEVALQRLGGNRALLRKLLQRFHDSQAAVAEQIRSALARAEQEEAVRLAHTLKGLAGNIGAHDLMHLAAELEAALRHQQQDQVPAALAAVETDVAELISALQAHQVAAADLNGPSGGVVPAAVTNGLRELQRLLADADGAAGEQLAALMPQLEQGGLAEFAAALQQAVDRYDYDQALQQLQRLLGSDATGGEE